MDLYDQAIMRVKELQGTKDFNNLLKFICDKVDDLIDNINHEYLAEFFSRMNDTYIYSETLNLWFEYDEYNKLRGGTKNPPISLSHYISKKLKIEFTAYKSIISMYNPTNEEENKIFKSRVKFVNDVIKKIGDTNYCDYIIKKLKYYCRVEDLEDKIDTNPKLICFVDKVYDVEQQEFRDIEKEDYLFFNTKFKVPEVDKKIRNHIISIIKDMFDNEEVYKYLIDTLSLSLIGNMNSKFFVWTGRGGNGKGLINSLLSNALGGTNGGYFYQTNNAFLTSESNDADKPSPQLYNLKGKRVAMISEPSGNKGKITFNQSFVKLITSNNDKITARQMRCNPISYTPLFTPILQCNEIPELSSVGNAEVRRFSVLNYPFQYVDNPTKENEKLMKTEYSDLFKQVEYGEQFILLLIDNLEKLIEKDNNFKLVEPKQVKTSTSEYLNDCDEITKWINENIEKASDYKTDKIKCSHLYNMFKEQINNVSKQKFNSHMKDAGYTRDNKCQNVEFWRYIRFKNNDDETDDEVNEKTRVLNV
jgi:P4 family phage/plasmid primase-like protien